MKTAIVVDWLVVYAGAEQVIEQMIACFPEADVFAVVDFLPPSQRHFLQGKKIKTSFIQSLPFSKRFYRHYLPLMPMAVEQWDLSEYDLILSSSHAVAKGVITGPEQIHISYVHSPMRYIWDLQAQYLKESNLLFGLKSYLTRYFFHKLRLWDYSSAARVDYFISNSSYIAKRIQKIYRRDAKVIYPPVMKSDQLNIKKEAADFYITASRMVPYKKIPLIVQAFKAMPNKRLVIIGDGPDMARVKALASPNVEILGYQPKAVLNDYLTRARGFVFAAIEDFGITLVEALSLGTPVIAFNQGGAREIVKDIASHADANGVFYDQQTVESIIDAVQRFEQYSFDAKTCIDSVKKFSVHDFKKQFSEYVNEICLSH